MVLKSDGGGEEVAGLLLGSKNHNTEKKMKEEDRLLDPRTTAQRGEE
jgi:hypothetical protein